MVKGLGLDLCEITRMEKLLADDRFLNRYFREEEPAFTIKIFIGIDSPFSYDFTSPLYRIEKRFARENESNLCG